MNKEFVARQSQGLTWDEEKTMNANGYTRRKSAKRQTLTLAELRSYDAYLGQVIAELEEAMRAGRR